MKTLLLSIGKEAAHLDSTNLNSIEKAISDFGYTILDTFFKIFNNGAITWGLILAESHFILHTYPEHDQIFCDMSTCSTNTESELRLLVKDIATALKGKVLNINIIDRR